MLYGKGFHGFLEVLSASEIPAYVIRLPSHILMSAYRRGKEISILLVILIAAIGYLHCFFVHSIILLI